MEVAGLVAKIIRQEKPAKVNIDVGGLGVGVYDRLVEQGHGDTVNAVNFGGKPVEPPRWVRQVSLLADLRTVARRCGRT
jgi:hypothetical protein